ncbi:MAG: hypothetical protein PHI26_04520, partial [Atopobiaceae bacterium]|nr:hypothetical protein [Atopobiaceae bacterium]
GGDASGTTATGGATVVTPAGDTIIPGSSAAADASTDAGATTATGGSSATSASTGSSGSTSTATSTSGGSSTASGTSTSGTSGSSSSASGSGSSDSSPASSGGSSSTTPSGHWETESYVVTAGYYRTVTDVAAYDETVVDTPASTTTEYVCSDGTVFSSSQYSELQAYVKAQVLAGNSCTWSQKTVTTPAVTHVVHHDAVTHQEWVPEVDGTRQVWVTD